MKPMRSVLVALCALFAKAAIAQTLYAPGGTVGTSSTGNVGVGTSSPAFKFEVVNDNFAAIRATGNSSNSIGIYVQNTVASGHQFALLSSGGSVAPVGSFVLWDDTAGSARLTISPAGNVGIGTTSPSNRLDVKSAGTSTAIGLETSSQAADAFRLIDADGSLRISSGVSVNLLNLIGSNVGIGTITPAYKLAVNGTIRAKEVIVDTDWSDFVFADNYRLAPLSEVESSIKADRHLPGIPSAQDVAEHGVSMGEMQAKLLAKIEELTLHAIAQGKALAAQNQEFSARLQRLEQENAQLRATR